jgi:3,4-dihydroxybenzoate---[aryl-carrier protein] ligase
MRFRVNHVSYDISDIRKQWRAWSRQIPLRELEGTRVALCLADAAELLQMVLYTREFGCSVLLLHGGTPFETARRLAGDAGCTRLLYGGIGDGLLQLDTEPKSTEVPLQSGGLLMYSSGTTGLPKLIGRSWADIDLEIAAYNQALTLDPEITPVVISPVNHAYGLISGVLSALARGAEPHIATYTNPKLTINLLQEETRHILYGVPVTLHTLHSLAPKQRFYQLMSSGAPMPQSLLELLSSVTAEGVGQQYGCSEAGCISAVKAMEVCHEVGRPLEHMEVTGAGDDAGRPAELVVRVNGQQLIRTGDLVYVEKGSLHWMSRLDDVINVSGLKVYPAEVENVILGLEGVRECVVYRGKHPVMGEQVLCMAAAEPRVTSDAIRSRCVGRLAPYKIPSQIQLVEKLPRNATGKISRKQLEEAERNP